MDENPGFTFVGNGPYLNRGCEAIVRGTAVIIRNEYQNPQFHSMSLNQNNIQADKDIDSDIHNYSMHIGMNLPWISHFLLRKIGIPWFPGLGEKVLNSLAVLALGGDNYSLDYGRPEHHLALIDFVRSKGKPFIIWGASLGPFTKEGPEYEKKILGHLKRTTGIFVREDISQQYLNENGLIDNVKRVSDPAFLLQSTAPKEDKVDFSCINQAIGFNFSPLMANYLCNNNMSQLVDIVSDVVEGILKKFNQPVVLVPHVFLPHTDDYQLLLTVSRNLQTKNHKVYLLPRDLSASELKWVISKFACFAGSRTHATISALSCGVPTISFAYSIKARGINMDVFGHDNYVLDPMNFSPNNVVDRIASLLSEETEIRKFLSQRIPQVKQSALKAGRFLKELI